MLNNCENFPPTTSIYLSEKEKKKERDTEYEQSDGDWSLYRNCVNFIFYVS